MAYSEWFPCSRSNKPYLFDTNTDVRSNHIKAMKLHQYSMRVEPSQIFREVFSAVVIWWRNRQKNNQPNKQTTAAKILLFSIPAWHSCHIWNSDWFDQEMNTSIRGCYIAAMSGWLRKRLGTSSLDSICCHSNLKWWQFWNTNKSLYLDTTWKVKMQSEQFHPTFTTAQIKLVPIHYLLSSRSNIMFKK